VAFPDYKGSRIALAPSLVTTMPEMGA